MKKQGKVYLVGAGPGDPGLITIKGLQYLREAQVVAYDRLVDRRLLEEAPSNAELIDVGKVKGYRREQQDEINALLVEKATEGKRVVRLKGGDPFIFGRGGEEAEALVKAGVPFEIVPGITSAIAAPAYAGIPLTHRRVASSVTIVSGSEDPTKENSSIDWRCLATGAGTLVVLMGWESLPRIVDTLREHGMAASTPAALVQWGTEPYQRTVTGHLKDILERGRQASLAPPVVAVFGQVVDLRDTVRWFDNKPLFGKRVLVPRTRTQASAFCRRLLEEGADPVEIPTIEIQPMEDFTSLDPVLASLSRYEWVIFTSTNGVEAVFQRLEQLGMDARAFGSTRVCAIGPATASSLKARGIAADFIPSEYISEAIVEGLGSKGLEGKHVLLLRAEEGRAALASGLSQSGAQVEEVPVYRTVVPKESRENAMSLLSGERVDVVAFTSSSTVRNLIDLLDGDTGPLEQATVACIGPITAQTAQEVGLKVDVVASEHTIPGLVEALAEHFSLAQSRR
ncbi:MAG: uroporphyrinogen-III C-methyltransferase [Chloroflexi bacterium]|nr:uroporphyrinogen-III C-methyltransferase [Chloroflexota bacterium]